MSLFVCYNGDIISSDKPQLTFLNRSFSYGDGLFESMRTRGTRILFLKEHYSRLEASMHILGMDKKHLPTINEIEAMVSRLLYRNKYLTAAQLRFTVFRDDSSSIFPSNNNIQYCITASPLSHGKYHLSENGFFIDIYSENPKYPTPFSTLNTTSAIYNIMAARWANSKRLNDCFLINHFGYLIETISSNFFIVKEDTLYTPSLETKCVPGIMRCKIIEIAQEMKIDVTEKHDIDSSYISGATEIILTNTIHGIQWVKAFRESRYFNRMSKALLSQLNEKMGLNS